MYSKPSAVPPFIKQRYIMGIKHAAAGHYYNTLNVVFGFEFVYGFFKGVAFALITFKYLKAYGYFVFVNKQ